MVMHRNLPFYLYHFTSTLVYLIFLSDLFIHLTVISMIIKFPPVERQLLKSRDYVCVIRHCNDVAQNRAWHRSGNSVSSYGMDE